ncbi:COMM domain-containing protein 8 [Patella vulgata]|uniref:COMM domain-containing protein 8 n=1 Tax=Patella vulgata TaxID=6465 RepID=UPI0021805ACF|nr:COMM domain-containing protein 8 [Patella vulgata]
MADLEEATELLKKCDVNEVAKLTHLVASRLCTNKNISYETYSKKWTLEEWWIVTNYLEDTLTKSAKNRLSKDEILNILSPLADEYKQSIIEVLSVRNDDLHQHLVSKTTHVSQNVLTDFDWQMKLIMSSDKLSSIHEPLLNLDLQTKDANNQSQVVSLELNKDDLKKLITSLDGASKAVQQLST